MRDLFWLTPEQLSKIVPFFPLPRGDDRRVASRQRNPFLITKIIPDTKAI